jgi:DNA-binding FadR family transcriptional regulator
MPVNGCSDLVYAILAVLREHGKPIGSGALYCRLLDEGLPASAPTIGRRMQELEQRGYLKKVRAGGRVLTPSGEKFFERLEQERGIDRYSANFLQLLKNGGRKEIFDVLNARRVVEGQIAALAAGNASHRLIRSLRKLLDEQRRAIQGGETGVDQDIGFHEAIADASGNTVLAAVTHLLRSHYHVNRAVSAIRSRIGTRSLMDHEAILQAITQREPAAARTAMEHHLSTIIADVNRCRKRISPKQASREA